MRSRFLAAVLAPVAAVLLVPGSALGQAKPSSRPANYQQPKTAWGDPDMQGIWNNVTATPLQRSDQLKDKAALSAQEAAELLRADGYVTACIGKWHVGGSPKERGFDVVHAGQANTKPSDTEGGKGEYDLRVTSESIGEPYKLRVQIAPGQPNKVLVTLPAYDVEEILSGLLG